MSGDFVRAATMSPVKTASGSFFGADAKAPTSTHAATTAPPCASTPKSYTAPPYSSMPGKRSIVTVANDHILRRIHSEPHLPTGPRPQEARDINNVKWRRPMRSSAITQYADAYSGLMQHNPFNKAAAGR